jgi:hypothetical protein
MVQMSTQRIFADGYRMSIIGVSRRYVADIHFSAFGYCTRHMESRNSDTTMNEEQYRSIRNHIFLLMMTTKPSPTSV